MYSLKLRKLDKANTSPHLFYPLLECVWINLALLNKHVGFIFSLKGIPYDFG